MMPTTNKSPITVIIVVEVVGVIPSGHTSAGLPVGSLAERTVRIARDDDEWQFTI